MRILYFDLDSMRPDHFGCYGYHRDTTPNMDRIAREGVRIRPPMSLRGKRRRRRLWIT